MSTKTEQTAAPSPAAETPTDVNSPDALAQEVRQGTIESIRSYVPFILDDQSTEIEDLRVLRDILDFAHSNQNSILTGVGHALWRYRSDVIWVSPEHYRAVAAFADQIEEDTEVSNPEDPQALGEKIGEELRSSLAQRVSSDFCGWAKKANDRDLLLVSQILTTAGSMQGRGEYNASFLCGIGDALGRNDAVFCPLQYVDQVESYIEKLTSKEVADHAGR